MRVHVPYDRGGKGLHFHGVSQKVNATASQGPELRPVSTATLPCRCLRWIMSGKAHNEQIGGVYEPGTRREEKLSNAAAGWVYRGTLSHRCRHRTIGSILRNGLRRSYSEQRRQPRRAGVHPNCEHV